MNNQKTNKDTIYVLRKWIPIEKLNWVGLSRNPNAIQILEANMDKIDWEWLSENPNAIHLLEANQDKISWWRLSRNPNATQILKANPDKINWRWLSENPNALHLLEANQDKIDWIDLSANPNAIQLLEANPDKISWWRLSQNPNAIHLLEANMDKIDWEWLSLNPAAIHLLEANQDKIDWKQLSENTNAIHLLEVNRGKIHRAELSRNPSIFEEKHYRNCINDSYIEDYLEIIQAKDHLNHTELLLKKLFLEKRFLASRRHMRRYCVKIQCPVKQFYLFIKNQIMIPLLVILIGGLGRSVVTIIIAAWLVLKICLTFLSFIPMMLGVISSIYKIILSCLFKPLLLIEMIATIIFYYIIITIYCFN